jgi:hypothetical protein
MEFFFICLFLAASSYILVDSIGFGNSWNLTKTKY